MHFDLPQALTFLIGVILPLLTGLVTKSTASSGTRAVTLLALSAVTSFLTNWLTAVNGSTPFDVGATFLGVAGAFLIGVGSYFGFWRPVGAAVAVQRLGGFIGRRSVR